MTRMSDKTRPQVVHTRIQYGRTILALRLSTAYPEPLFPTEYARIAKNFGIVMKRSLRRR